MKCCLQYLKYNELHIRIYSEICCISIDAFKIKLKSFKPIPYEIKSTAPNLRPQQIYKPMQSSSPSESYLSKSKSVRRDCI